MISFNPGDKVTYVSPHKQQRGIVKSVVYNPDNEYVFVVYDCGEDWDNYKDYTAARTRLVDLVEGW